jgi:hypothetical protein
MKIIRQAQVRLHRKETPGVLGEGGWLFLTEDKVVFAKTGMRVIYKALYNEKELEKLYNEGKVKLEIPISSIIEAAADTKLATPYLRVRYRSQKGDKVLSFIHAGDMIVSSYSSFVEDIYRIKMEHRQREAPGKEAERLQRDLVIVDQSHDQGGQARNAKIVDTLNGVCSQLQLAVPLALQGHPTDELFITNQHHLPNTALLILFGMKKGKFEKKELALICDYVKNGGQLLLTADAPYDPPNIFLEPFGVKLLKEIIEDEINNDGKHKDHIIVKNFSNHPVNAGVNAACFGKYGCYPIEASPNAIVLASSSNNAKPPNLPVATLTPYGNGQILIIGQTSLFQDDFVNKLDNERWLKNIITFLLSQQTPTYLLPPPPPPPPPPPRP